MKILTKVGAVAGAVIISLAMLGGTASAQTAPTVTLTPGPAGPYLDQQVITVSVGPNTLFPANQSVKILECSVGATSDAQCDGNTIQADSILTKSDGSFSYNAYQLFQLPSTALGEPPTNHPICNATVQCVLYVGLNQTNFNQPMVFSNAFNIDSPGTPIPETPYLPLLPLGAVVVLGGGYLVFRRRQQHAAKSI
jgi:hypothetical protein